MLLDRGAAVDLCLDGATPLLVAYRKGDLDVMRSCLERGADVNLANEEGKTILYDSCKNGHVDAARLLLDKGAEADRADKHGRTPLVAAKGFLNHDALVVLFAEHLDSKFPIHAAARTGDVEAMTQLLDGGAEVDAKKDGATPLHIACEKGHVELVRLLLEKGLSLIHI